MDKIIDTIKAHPTLFIILAVAVAAYFLFSGSSSSTSNNSAAADAAAQANAVAASDQAEAQLQTVQSQTQLGQAAIGGQVQIAQIQAQAADAANSTQLSAINAQIPLAEQTNQMSDLNSIINNAFTVASQAISSNYNTQLSYASTLPGYAGATTQSGGNSAYTYTSAGDVAGVQNLNTANTQEMSMFDNLLSAVGASPNRQNEYLTTTGAAPTAQPAVAQSTVYIPYYSPGASFNGAGNSPNANQGAGANNY